MLVDWAATKHVDALSDDVLGKFRDHLLVGGQPVHDFEAAYRIWVRNEAKFAADGRARSPAIARRAGRAETALATALRMTLNERDEPGDSD